MSASSEESVPVFAYFLRGELRLFGDSVGFINAIFVFGISTSKNVSLLINGNVLINVLW